MKTAEDSQTAQACRKAGEDEPRPPSHEARRPQADAVFPMIFEREGINGMAAEARTALRLQQKPEFRHARTSRDLDLPDVPVDRVEAFPVHQSGSR